MAYDYLCLYSFYNNNLINPDVSGLTGNPSSNWKCSGSPLDSVVQMTAGEKTAFDLGIHGMHAELLKLVGRLKFRTSYGQNGLQHTKEVAMLIVQEVRRVSCVHQGRGLPATVSRSSFRQTAKHPSPPVKGVRSV